MNTFQAERDRWYAARDDRTGRNQHVRAFHQSSVAIIVDPKCATSSDLQVSLMVAANILSRWCRKVRLDIPPMVSLLPLSKGRDLGEIILALMRDSDPFGDFTAGQLDECKFDHILVVGRPARSSRRSATWISANGWLAGIGFDTAAPEIETAIGRNPTGAAFAACLGVSEIFKMANGLTPPAPYEAWVSLFDYVQSPAASGLSNPPLVLVDGLGLIDVVGCGAIGSSFVALAGLSELSGRFRLIDFDPVSEPNCSSSLVFSYKSVGADKVAACAEYLGPSKIVAEPFNGSYSQFVETGKPFDLPPDVLLCFANEQNVWSAIQNNMPPVVLHATTTPSWGLNFGRHMPMADWCILCRFGGQLDSGFAPPCAVGEMPATAQAAPILASLPFLSPASAIVALAETLKMGMGNLRDPNNFIDYSMKPVGSRGRFMRQQRSPDPACLCRRQSPLHYPPAVRKTRFWEYGR